MNCNICNKPIILKPTAAERAAKDTTGKTAKYYTNLFQQHAECKLKEREKETYALIRQKTKESKSKGFNNLLGGRVVPLTKGEVKNA